MKKPLRNNNKMVKFANFLNKMKHVIIHHIWVRLVWLHNSCIALILSFLHILIFQLHPFWIELLYFLTISSLGFLALKASKTRNNLTSFVPKNFDLFFTSVSAVTVSSLTTVEMEVFSNTQLIFLTVLMFCGGEVFTSILGLHLMKARMKARNCHKGRVSNYIYSTESDSSNCSGYSIDHIELGSVTDQFEGEKTDNSEEENSMEFLKLKCIKILPYIVSCYLIVFHVLGSILIAIYLNFIPSAKQVLEHKGLKISTFSVFTTVSTFANCGFVPTNENMVVFKKNSGLLLILIPQILMGNTLYAVALHFVIFLAGKITRKEEFMYMVKNGEELGYMHLMSGLHSVCLGITAVGFIGVQMMVFCSLEWNSEGIKGLSVYQKFVGSLFQVVNSRHSGESVFDLSKISSAILVLFVLMMYLPPRTRFVPFYEEAKNVSSNYRGGNRKRKWDVYLDELLFSQLTYLVIFIILICITEREKIKRDPLNFNVLNIVVEVIGAYGNVGFSTGYSCERQINYDNNCKDLSYGFAGRWSDGGKLVLIVVMFFGRLKKFNTKGGNVWRLS